MPKCEHLILIRLRDLDAKKPAWKNAWLCTMCRKQLVLRRKADRDNAHVLPEIRPSRKHGK